MPTPHSLGFSVSHGLLKLSPVRPRVTTPQPTAGSQKQGASPASPSPVRLQAQVLAAYAWEATVPTAHLQLICLPSKSLSKCASCSSDGWRIALVTILACWAHLCGVNAFWARVRAGQRQGADQALARSSSCHLGLGQQRAPPHQLRFPQPRTAPGGCPRAAGQALGTVLRHRLQSQAQSPRGQAHLQNPFNQNKQSPRQGRVHCGCPSWIHPPFWLQPRRSCDFREARQCLPCPDVPAGSLGGTSVVSGCWAGP